METEKIVLSQYLPSQISKQKKTIWSTIDRSSFLLKSVLKWLYIYLQFKNCRKHPYNVQHVIAQNMAKNNHWKCDCYLIVLKNSINIDRVHPFFRSNSIYVLWKYWKFYWKKLEHTLAYNLWKWSKPFEHHIDNSIPRDLRYVPFVIYSKKIFA